MPIKRLPQDAIDKLKSTVTITSLNEVITCLIKNSLDASATKIHVSLDYARGNCYVEDNGFGIPSAEFAENGGLGKLHHTSKHPPNPAIHGRRGDFLASLAELSLLHIASRPKGRLMRSAMTFHNGRVLFRGCSDSSMQQEPDFEHGTSITVRNLFGNLPVRVKQRAASGIETTIQSRMWTEIVQKVANFLLSWPIQVMVVLRDHGSERGLRLQAPPRDNLVTRTSTLLMQAALLDPSYDNSWVPVSSVSSLVSVSGCFSLRPVPTRRSQFLSLGIEPVENVSGHNILFEEVNRIFRNSSFGLQEQPLTFLETQDRLKDWQNRRGPDKHPAFYLRIEAHNAREPRVSEDLLQSGDSGILRSILDLLRAISYGFLKSHYFRPQKLNRESSHSPASTSRKHLSSERCIDSSQDLPGAARPFASSTRTSGRPFSPFDGWNRVKIGLPSNMPPKGPMPSNTANQRLIGADGMVLRRPFPESQPNTGEMNTPMEPTTSTYSESAHYDLHSNNTKTPSGSEVVRMSNALHTPRHNWLADIVRIWENPIFEPVVRADAMAYADNSCTPEERSHHWVTSGEEAAFLDRASIGTKRQLHKDSLRSAEVIGQVDTKFILIKTFSQNVDHDTQETATLVMLDQHAVDERCQLEDLMAGYFEQDTTGLHVAKTELLEDPVKIEMPRQELALLRQYHKHFRHWGLHYSVLSTTRGETGDASSTAILVNSLPPSIIERCRTEPKLLVDIVRNEIWRLHDAGGMPSKTLQHSGVLSDHHWVGLFCGCPRGILDLLHSRACRSAIMFNDPLNKDECTRLVERLSNCVFPFQCAHGRPSMAPVLEMGSEPHRSAWSGEEPPEERRARWREWAGA